MTERGEPDNVTHIEVAAAWRVLKRARAALARTKCGPDAHAKQAQEADELLLIVATWRRDRPGAGEAADVSQR
jgi:hypothetical protein